MGVVNVTPDSFYDGGKFFSVRAAVEHGRALVAQGADLLDVGGESTRPGAPEVSEAEELRRVLDVVERLRKATSVPISIDTRKPAVARAALERGAALVNDVTGLVLPEMRKVVHRADAGVVIMHMRGTPTTMQRDTTYRDLPREVVAFLRHQASLAQRDGIGEDQIVIDPGVGFGKSYEGNLLLLGRIDLLRSLGYPVLVGASRKSFLGALLGGKPPSERLEASVAAATIAALQGAEMVRVHDVAPTVAALRVADAVRTGRLPLG
jgi:dihydropteroate synthase